jgi:hypothetical protein
MDFYPFAMGYIPTADMDTFRLIRTVLERMPNIVFGESGPGLKGCKNQASCHLVCRALAHNFNVTAHDGYFASGYQHSWLRTPSGMSIIDAYPVAGAVPFIVSADRYSPWPGLYKGIDNFLGPKLKTRQFKKQLSVTKKAMQEAIVSLGIKPLSG